MSINVLALNRIDLLFAEIGRDHGRVLHAGPVGAVGADVNSGALVEHSRKRHVPIDGDLCRESRTAVENVKAFVLNISIYLYLYACCVEYPNPTIYQKLDPFIYALK